MMTVIPEDAELEFAVYKPTGTVHIHQYVPRPGAEGYEEATENLSFAEGLEAMFTTHQRMLCGAHFLINILGAPGDWTDRFEDDAICARCVRALGGQSARAFEHARPGDDGGALDNLA
jgi:hypothetical protein